MSMSLCYAELRQFEKCVTSRFLLRATETENQGLRSLKSLQLDTQINCSTSCVPPHLNPFMNKMFNITKAFSGEAKINRMNIFDFERLTMLNQKRVFCQNTKPDNLTSHPERVFNRLKQCNKLATAPMQNPMSLSALTLAGLVSSKPIAYVQLLCIHDITQFLL